MIYNLQKATKMPGVNVKAQSGIQKKNLDVNPIVMPAVEKNVRALLFLIKFL